MPPKIIFNIKRIPCNLKAQLFFAVIRATDLCLKGPRVSWRSGTGIDDGAGLPVVKFVIVIYMIFGVCHRGVCKMWNSGITE